VLPPPSPNRPKSNSMYGTFLPFLASRPIYSIDSRYFGNMSRYIECVTTHSMSWIYRDIFHIIYCLPLYLDDIYDISEIYTTMVESMEPVTPHNV
jgi:hypothetical protein